MAKKRTIAGLAFAWDAAWKVTAIVVAVRRREHKWILPLALSNTVGLLPMFYLWRARRQGREEAGEGEELAAA